MSNYAIHSGGTIINVIVADSQEVAEQVTGMFALETEGIPWIGWTLIEGEWVRPSPFPSWTLDENYDWQPPTPMPEEGEWSWDEPTLSWVSLT